MPLPTASVTHALATSVHPSEPALRSTESKFLIAGQRLGAPVQSAAYFCHQCRIERRRRIAEAAPFVARDGGDLGIGELGKWRHLPGVSNAFDGELACDAEEHDLDQALGAAGDPLGCCERRKRSWNT